MARGKIYNVYQGNPESVGGGNPVFGLTKNELFLLIEAYHKQGGNVQLPGRKVYVQGKIFTVFEVDSSVGKDPDEVKVYYQKLQRAIFAKFKNDSFFLTKGKNVTRAIFKSYDNSIGKKAEPMPLKTKKVISDNRKVFVSHSSKDHELVSKFVEQILMLGFGVNEKDIFYTSGAGTGIKSGEDFKKRIENEIKTCKAVIQIITPAYKRSEVCLNEMGAAWAVSEIVIPLIGPPDYEYEVGFIHSNTQQLKLNSKENLHQLFDDYKDELFDSEKKTSIITTKIDDFIKSLSDEKN